MATGPLPAPEPPAPAALSTPATRKKRMAAREERAEPASRSWRYIILTIVGLSLLIALPIAAGYAYLLVVCSRR